MSYLESLPVPVYTTDTEGRITFYNEAAVQLWGHSPELGSAKWCGSWRLFWPDGRPMAYEECPMAIALRDQRPVLGMEVTAERVDGSRVVFTPYPNTVTDENGTVIGAINLLLDITDRKNSEFAEARLAAIVASSNDAIVSKRLDGTITSWNDAATRILGYLPEEMIGQSIRSIIPPELQNEEDGILRRLKNGERVEHFETVRIAKDGRRVDLSVTISPIRTRSGVLIGASKVARDISERKRAEELQRLLFDELNHRVKNTLATVQAIASQSMRTSSDPREFVESFNDRVKALARAHDLLVRQKMIGANVADLVRGQLSFAADDSERISIDGPDVVLESRVAVQLALVLHELATNARKHGALATRSGSLSINWYIDVASARELHLIWKESEVPNVAAPRSRGFGTTLIERSLEANQGSASIRYESGGIRCEIRLPLREEIQPVWSEMPASAGTGTALRHKPSHRRNAGKRILLVEDEPLVAMEVEEDLKNNGYVVVGPAAHIESARRMIAEEAFDAVLLDANLGGHQVGELAAALVQKGIPFAFATGYGRDGLPEPFRDAELISKPFDPARLLATVERLLDSTSPSESDVVPLRPKTRPAGERNG